MIKMRLDVGCGNIPRGDVNVDLVINHKAKNFVKTDALHLPFKHKTFTVVIASHIIEHFDNPFLFLNQLKYVARKRIKIYTPFWFSYEYFALLRGRCHKRWFFPSWFKKQGFHTKVIIHFIRPTLLRKKMPCYVPFFEIIAISDLV